MSIHPTAVIEESVFMEEGVSVGPYAVLRGNLKIGKNSSIAAHAVIEGHTSIGPNCRIGIGAVIGNPPQDLKYAGEDTRVEIGENTVIREYVTVNRGTTARMKTSIGSGVLLMSYVHIAHDCIVGDGAILANCATLAGHVTVEEGAIIGGLTPVHQFARVGAFSIIGGGTRISKDVVPFSKIAGNPARMAGLNMIGLRRRGFSEEERNALAKAYRTLFRSKMNTTQALEALEADSSISSENVRRLIHFIRSSSRGICK